MGWSGKAERVGEGQDRDVDRKEQKQWWIQSLGKDKGCQTNKALGNKH